MVICAAFGCNSRSGRDRVSFFAFPKDKRLRKIWAFNIGRGAKSTSNGIYEPTPNSKVCSLHFDENCFVHNSLFLERIGFGECFKKKLKEGAIPTIFKFKQNSAEKYRRQTSATEKRRKKVQPEINIIHVQDETDPLTGPPSENHPHQLSDLDTLASVACNAEPANEGEIDHFNVQCQTPAWRKPAKEVQVGPAAVCDAGTQTEWEVCLSPTLIESVHESEEDVHMDSVSDLSDWEPSSGDEDEDTEGVCDFERFTTTERKFIVYEAQLDKLLETCVKCGSKLSICKTVTGMLLRCVRHCKLCNESDTWLSQPTSGSMAMGHLDISAAIMFSGCGPTKFLRALNFGGVVSFSEQTYFNMQRLYLSPAVSIVWDHHQSQLIDTAIQNGIPLRLGGDGRCDSPGHTAKYGSYSVMDLGTGKIIDIQLVQSNEVKNSYAMELEGLQRSLNFLVQEKGLQVSHFVTDRHASVKKYMREQQPNIIHWYDVWHVGKGVFQKLEAAGNKKGCEKVRLWARSVSNHLYWSAATSNGDGDLVVQKWQSILNHVCNIHEGHGDRFPKCEHGQLDERLWMQKGFKPYDELSKVVNNKVLLKDIRNLSPCEQTSGLEAFHKVLCGWVPKFTHYMHLYMDSRSKVAALHFNENARRKVNKTKQGVAQYSISYPRGRKGEPVVKEVKSAQTFGYVEELMQCVQELRASHSSYKKAKEAIPVQGYPSPLTHSVTKRPGVSKKELVENHVSRFNRY